MLHIEFGGTLRIRMSIFNDDAPSLSNW